MEESKPVPESKLFVPRLGGQKFIDLWIMCQYESKKIIRFKKYVERFPEFRPQSDLDHMCSLFVTLPYYFQAMRNSGATLDYALLYEAFSVHELGEFILKRDVTYLEKTEEHDVAEWLAFEEYTKKWNSNIHKAFLLQFAHIQNPSVKFPEYAREIIVSLYSQNYFEAIAFNIIERMDYILYGRECYRISENVEAGKTILTHILRNQVPHLNTYADMPIEKRLPGMGTNYWDKEYRRWAENFIADHSWIQDEKEMFAKAQ